MVRMIRATVFAFALCAANAIAAPIPTPAPGSGVPLSQPTPINPVQYVVAPGAIGSSAALNSTFYKVYTDLGAVINALNACSYIPGAAIGTIAVASPLNVSIGSCSSGTGTGATATITLGGVVPQANLPLNVLYSGSAIPASTVTGVVSAANLPASLFYAGSNLAANSVSANGANATTGSLGTTTNGGANGIIYFGSPGGGYANLDFAVCNANAFSFMATGCSSYRSAYATTFVNASDSRLKRDVTTLGLGLDAVRRLRPVAFRWRVDGSPEFGFIGQEVAPVLPPLVHRDSRGTYLLNYSGIIPVLVRAVQQQQTEIAQLRAQVRALRH